MGGGAHWSPPPLSPESSLSANHLYSSIFRLQTLSPIARIGSRNGGWSQKANQGWINPPSHPLLKSLERGHKARFGYPLLLTLFMCCRTHTKNRASSLPFASLSRWVSSKPRVEPEVCMAPFLILMKTSPQMLSEPFWNLPSHHLQCTARMYQIH